MLVEYDVQQRVRQGKGFENMSFSECMKLGNQQLENKCKHF